MMQNDVEVAMELMNLLEKDTSIIKDVEIVQQQKAKKHADTTFEDMTLPADLLQSLYKLKIDKPSQIQQLSIPIVSEGSDCVIQSESGTGKTFAYMIGVIPRIEKGKSGACVILSPTKVLSLQLKNEIEKLVDLMGLRVEAIQKKRDAVCTAEILVGSPGTMVKLFKENRIRNTDFLIVDEADATLDTSGMGVDTIEVIKKCRSAQLIYYSATYTDNIMKVIKVNSKPNLRENYTENTKPDEILIYSLELDRNEKEMSLMKLYSYLPIGQSIVFCCTKKMVDRLKEKLEKDSFMVSFLHGEMEEEERLNAYTKFQTTQSKILIATDVFSRGMDVPAVNLVVNYDIPKQFDSFQTYIHRIGRGGRFGRAGFVIDFVCNEEDMNFSLKYANKLGCTNKKFTLKALEQAYEKLSKAEEEVN